MSNAMVEEPLIKSRERVQALGEVFTPKWIVDFMLDYVGDLKGLKVLEPSAGEGAFLTEILRRKLAVVAENFFRLSPTHPPTISKNFQETLIASDTPARAESSKNFQDTLIADDTSARTESSKDLQEVLIESDALTHAESSKDFQEALIESDTPAHAESNILQAMLAELETIYGIELDGENIKVARRKMLEAFCEYYRQVFEVELEECSELFIAAQNIIHSHIIEADALEVFAEMFEPLGPVGLFNEREYEMSGIKFDFIIGNPPYQEDKDENSDNKNFSKPIYNRFLEESYKVCDKVMMIHPARCLFNAGATPKDFNQRMLSDEHIKVIKYEPDSSKVFKGVDIEGGIAVTYRDANKNFGAIDTFTAFDKLNSIFHKVVVNNNNFKSFSDIVYARTIYRFNGKLHEDYPEAKNNLSKGHLYDISSNILDLLPFVFFDDKPNDDKNYIKVYGRQNSKRVYKYICRDYIRDFENIDKYKVFIPKSNGSGALGESTSTVLIGEPFIGEPLSIVTETFISIGAFDTRDEAEATLKYIKTKFARVMLGILKVTQDNTREKWAKVPLQDFTSNSDIDWSQSIKDIDQQLYQKYNLTQEEINFIETHVKEME